MNRRTFLKALGIGGLVAAAPQIIVPERKVWALDRTMILAPREVSIFHKDAFILLTMDDGGFYKKWEGEPGQVYPMVWPSPPLGTELTKLEADTDERYGRWYQAKVNLSVSGGVWTTE